MHSLREAKIAICGERGALLTDWSRNGWMANPSERRVQKDRSATLHATWIQTLRGKPSPSSQRWQVPMIATGTAARTWQPLFVSDCRAGKNCPCPKPAVPSSPSTRSRFGNHHGARLGP
ncbi:hypothetical protein L917_19139 [Phytophthora nicotianae]|uniref:Uncharacterized protein n=1 Tax=Phytophthora nicotianae TaxID=4792 RepID=W2K5C2_PHYNI|nr:hypothetical protein L917_19139 [Phytophthora nicotianae]